MTEIRAIETRYKGYRFRSRLEARWAVFFDYLGVEWTYEQEGYELPGGRYLPDFWLPKIGRGCFVEVKPCDLSESEDLKANELAEHSNQFVMAFCGNPWPEELRVFQFRRKPDPEPELSAFFNSLTDDRVWIASSCDWRRYYAPILAAQFEKRVKGQSYSPVNKSEVCLAWCRTHSRMVFGFNQGSRSCCDKCGCMCNTFDPLWTAIGQCSRMRECYDDFDDCDEIVAGHELQQAFERARSARFEHGESP